MVINYENGDPKSSEFYDFNSKSQSLSDSRKDYINNQINLVKTLYNDLEIQKEQDREERRRNMYKTRCTNNTILQNCCTINTSLQNSILQNSSI